MTLQQKLLAKQSKKGFTLVELVVVIAILAILAAIAIPAVVGIIDNATKSAKESNASMLDAAAKKLYAGVSAGSINASSNDQELGGLSGSKSTKLPAASATTSTKRSYAGALTINDAILYDGLASKFANENPQDYKYSSTDGTIIYTGGNASSGYRDFIPNTVTTFSSVTTNLKNLYEHTTT